MILEPNNLINEAIDSGVSTETEQSATFSGSIDFVSDTDLYKFQLNRGQGITLDIDTVNGVNNFANFDSYLRVFDAQGNELSFNDDFTLESEEFSLDSYIGFIANQTAEYYVGVSSSANSSYNPVNGDNSNQSSANFVAGDYDLTLDIVEVIADLDADNTITEAIGTEIGSSALKSLVLTGEIDSESDVDVYQFQLAAGEGIKLNVNAQANDFNLDSYLRVFDGEGNELAFDDNSSNSPPEVITTDSSLDFAPATPGIYYVGVSSAGNFDYDGVNGNTNLNLSPNTGISQGRYELQLDVAEIIADTDADNTIAEAIDSGVTTGNRSEVLSGTIDPAFDVDMYQVQLGEGDGIELEINAASIDSSLDSFLRLFDSQGNELTFDNNDDANLRENFSTDSAIAFAPTTPGSYFIGVGASGNFDYDAVNGRTNFSTNTVEPFSTTGNYELEIDLVEVIGHRNPDNIIPEAVDSGINARGTNNADELNGTEQPDEIRGLEGNDTIFGAGQNDNIIGGGNNDYLLGNDGNDAIQGNRGNDVILGGAGNDTLNGNQDLDTLTGGAGADVFILGSNNGLDTIADFTDGIDKINLADDLNFSSLTVSSLNSDTRIAIAISGQIIGTIADIEPGLISAADFL